MLISTYSIVECRIPYLKTSLVFIYKHGTINHAFRIFVFKAETLLIDNHTEQRVAEKNYGPVLLFLLCTFVGVECCSVIILLPFIISGRMAKAIIYQE